MAFVVSSLPDYVERNRDLLVKKAVLGGKTIERINVQTGIKKVGKINVLDVAPVAVAGSSCGFSASGNTTFTDRSITTAAIKYNTSWCPQTLLGKWTEYQAKIAAQGNSEALPFEEAIAEQLVEHANADTEKLIWQGDTTSLNDLLKLNDGLIKLALNDSSVIDVTIADGASAYEAVKAMYLAIPEASLEGTEIYVSPDVFRKFTQELIEKNYYHFAPENANLREIVFPGSDVKVVKTDGLAGASYLFAANPKNLYYGCDLENDIEEFKIWFSDDNDEYRVKVSWNPGINYAVGAEVVLGTCSGSISAGTGVVDHLAKLSSTVNSDGQIEILNYTAE